MAINESLYSDLPIPPGEYLEEVIDGLGITKNELAGRLGRPASKLSAIFKGKKAITPDTALQLERVVGVPAHIWTGLESEYRLALARGEKERELERLKAESYLITRFRYADLARLGFVKKKTRNTDKVLELSKFLGVASLENVRDLRRYDVAYRLGAGKKKVSPEALVAWLRIGELAAHQRQCTRFDRNKLKEALNVVRTMTSQSPENFQERLRQVLAESGVALVLCPYLSGTRAHGAIFWLNREKAVIMMTLRYNWADIFWFTLFHELGHILLHNRQGVIIEGVTGDSPQDRKRETEADRFAADTLIPPSSYQGFVRRRRFYQDDIITFASQIAIHPGIVVGRLQKYGLLDPSWHNKLRDRFEWKQ